MVDFLSSAFNTTTPLSEIATRMVAACFFGFVIGFDRERRGRPAGLRTNMLTALAACAFALISIEMIAGLGADNNRTQLDPIRVVEAVTSGVAFLAAGAIIQSRGDVKGLTTGAGMWLAGSVGLASGAGYLAIGFIATGLALLILAPLYLLETNVFQHSEREKNSESTQQ